MGDLLCSKAVNIEVNSFPFHPRQNLGSTILYTFYILYSTLNKIITAMKANSCKFPRITHSSFRYGGVVIKSENDLLQTSFFQYNGSQTDL